MGELGELPPSVAKLLELGRQGWTEQCSQGAGWGSKSTDRATWEYKPVAGCPFAAWRFTIPVDVSPEYAASRLATPHFIQEWDASITGIEVIEDHGHGNLIYSVKKPPMVASRDSLVMGAGCVLTPEEAMRYGVARTAAEAGPPISPDWLESTGQLTKPYRHADRSSAAIRSGAPLRHCFALGLAAVEDPRKPASDAHVRAKLICGGFLGVPEGPRRTRVAYVQLADPGGSFPPFVVNSAGRFELASIWKLKKALEDAYALCPAPKWPLPPDTLTAAADSEDLVSCTSEEIPDTADIYQIAPSAAGAPAAKPRPAAPDAAKQRRALRIALLRAALSFAVAVAASRGSLSTAAGVAASVVEALAQIAAEIGRYLLSLLRRYARRLVAAAALGLGARDLHSAWRIRSAPKPAPPALPPPQAAAAPRAAPAPAAGAAAAAPAEDPGLPDLVRKLLEFHQAPGWTNVESGEVVWDNKVVPHNKTPAVRMSTTATCPMGVVCDFMRDPTNMRRYEALLDTQEILVDERPVSTVMHATFKTPSSLVQCRDLVTQAQSCLLRPQEAAAFGLQSAAEQGDAPFQRYGYGPNVTNCFVVGTQSVEHPSKPPSDTHTRAQSFCTGYIFTPLPGGQVRITFVLDFDPKGWIPSSVIKMTLNEQKKKLFALRRCLEEDARRAPPPAAAAPAAAPPAGSPRAAPGDAALPDLARRLLEFNQGPGWTSVERGDVEWDQKEVPHNKTPAVRMSITLNAPVRVAAAFLRDSTNMKRYEELLDTQEILVDERPVNCIMYCTFKTPSWMVQCRDLLTRSTTCLLTHQEAVQFGLLAAAGADEGGGAFDRHGFDGEVRNCFVLAAQSAEHPARPPVDTHTRARSYCTGYIVTPTADPKRCRLTFVLDFSPEGMIPASVTKITLFLQKKKLTVMKSCIEEDARKAPPPQPAVPPPALASPAGAAAAASASPAPPTIPLVPEGAAAPEPLPEVVHKLLEMYSAPGWTTVAEGRTLYESLPVSHSAIPAVRFTTTVQCTMEAMCDFLADTPGMKRYEEMIDEFEILDENPAARVIYATFVNPPGAGWLGIQQRDMVSCGTGCLLTPQEAVEHGVVSRPEDAGAGLPFGRHNLPSRGYKGKVGHCFALGARSVTHPAKPEREGFVRAHTFISGWLVSPAPGGQGVRLVFVLSFDPKGWLPAKIIEKTNGAQRKKLGVIRRLLESSPTEAA
eukprot:TRINITY_DN15530_c0_g1_i1.p1 TRINITY_DN15530_c0_g1~~TRINITY_DN15530_c0_g1_i1.p1  ORF type:complete len:1241 (+),score=363.43 TRINITY_DN15530_c0_g1_i1:103-3723(+)